MSGPLVIAEEMAGSSMHELVKVGWSKLIGEIIKLDKDTASIQCYEDTSGLTVGDPIQRTFHPLSVELGPGILENIFDGIQRPLEAIANLTKSLYVPKGIDINPLDIQKLYEFKPRQNLTVGGLVSGGDILGNVFENNLLEEHKILLEPKNQGRLVYLAGPGNYNIKDTIAEVEFNGKVVKCLMSHSWAVRESRPIAEKLEGNTPLLTGQRVLDSLFPSILGGTCCIPGAFGCGKTVISQALSKYSNS